MKCLILCDVDGTLLRNDNTVSIDTISYINELSLRHYFCLVTSSSYQKILPLYNQLGLKTHMVCKNGGLIINPVTTEKIVHVLTKNEILNHFNNLKDVISSMFYKCESNAFCYNFDERYKIIMNIPNTVTINNGDFNNLNLADSTNLYIITEPKYSNTIESYFLKLDLLVDCIGKDQKRAIYVITHKMAVKEKCIDFFNNTYSFDKIIGFGDTTQDVKLLEKCDEGFLMKNSSVKNSKLKQTTSTNNEDGVIIELKRMDLI